MLHHNTLQVVIIPVLTFEKTPQYSYFSRRLLRKNKGIWGLVVRKERKIAKQGLLSYCLSQLNKELMEVSNEVILSVKSLSHPQRKLLAGRPALFYNYFH